MFSYSGFKGKRYAWKCMCVLQVIFDLRWSQMAAFILYPYILEGQRHLLLCLTKVNMLLDITTCTCFRYSTAVFLILL